MVYMPKGPRGRSTLQLPTLDRVREHERLSAGDAAPATAAATAAEATRDAATAAEVTPS